MYIRKESRAIEGKLIHRRNLVPRRALHPVYEGSFEKYDFFFPRPLSRRDRLTKLSHMMNGSFWACRWQPFLSYFLKPTSQVVLSCQVDLCVRGSSLAMVHPNILIVCIFAGRCC
jgi:hypothetical protein